MTLGQAHRTGIWDRYFTIGTTGILLQVYYRNFRTGTLNDKNVKQQFEDRTLIKKNRREGPGRIESSGQAPKDIFVRTGPAGQK